MYFLEEYERVLSTITTVYNICKTNNGNDLEEKKDTL